MAQESRKSKLEYNINSMFNNMSYFVMYNNDIWLTIIILTVVFFVTSYFFFKNSIQVNRLNWEENKCNPIMMPFGKLLNPGSSSDFNENNFQNCTKDLLSGLSINIKDPISAIFSMFGGILSLASSLMSSIMAFFLYLFNMLLNFFRQLILIMQKLVGNTSEIFATVSNTIGNILGFLSVLYNQIIVVIDSIKYIFPVMAASFTVAIIIPTIVFLVVSIVMLMFGISLAAGIFTMPIGIPIVVLFSVIVAIAIFFFIMVKIIHDGFVYASDRIVDMARIKQHYNFYTIPPDYVVPEEEYNEQNQ